MRLGPLIAGRHSILLALAFAGCATAGGGSSSPRNTGPEVDVDAAIAALQDADALYEAGDYAAAAAAADELYAEWRDTPSLSSLAERALLLGARSDLSAGLMGPAGDRYAELLARDPDVDLWPTRKRCQSVSSHCHGNFRAPQQC